MKKKREVWFPYGDEMRLQIRKMKLTAILLFIVCVTFGNSFSQVRLTVRFDKTDIHDVLQTIEEKTDYIFLYKDKIFDFSKKISGNFNEAKFEDVLNSFCDQTNISYEIRDRQIILKEKEVIPLPAEQQPQKKSISGKVTDSFGGSLPGVSVVVKGTTNGIITDTNGEFSLSGIPANATLVFSFVGLQTEEVAIEGKTTINVTLNEDAVNIEEVVAVGYGTQKKVNLTGSVSSIKGEILENRPIAAVGAGLQGLLPGVTITSSSGQPGSPGVSILVRGINTINSQTNPLILIDGVAGGDINLVNPDDIESVSVLKDAASSAIYGARAANGVILITTKKGKSEGKAAFSYSGYYGIQTPVSLPELVNGREYMTLENEARSARGVAIPYSDEAFMKYDSKNFPNDYSNTDWISETYKKYATQQSHNFNINGRSDKSSYYMSYGYLEQDGIIVGDPFFSSRNNVRLRLNTEVSNRLKLDGNLSYWYRRLDRPLFL